MERFRARTRGLGGAAARATSLGPGLADAGLSSLAGFAASLYAARFLDGPELGAYALYLSAVLLATLVPQHLVFLPSQIAALESPRDARPGLLPPTLAWGAGLSALTVPFAAAAGLLLAGQMPSSTLVALAAGASLLLLVAPAQDHVRSTLHLAARPRQAAAMSGAQLALALAAIAALHLLDVPAAWVPFSALALAAAGATAFGLALALSGGVPPLTLPPLRLLVALGAPLLPAAAVQEAAGFVSVALVGTLASAAALGSAEAARIASRPLQVFSLGLSRSLAPRLMEAGQQRSRPTAAPAMRLYVIAMACAGLAYGVIAGWPHALNPLRDLVPLAYEEQGLVALVLLATLAGAVAQVPRAVLLGARRNRDVLSITSASSALRVLAVAALASPTGAFALPLSQLAGALVAGWLFSRVVATLLTPDASHGRGEA